MKQLLDAPICFEADPDDTSLLFPPAAADAIEALRLNLSISDSNSSLPDFGVPRSCLREILRGSLRVLVAVWEYWRTKRQSDVENLPLLSRLRREAAEMKVRRHRHRAQLISRHLLSLHLHHVGLTTLSEPTAQLASTCAQPVLRLRQARHSRLSLAHSELFRLRSHLVRVRHLLSLVKRREKLKYQIVGLSQAIPASCTCMRSHLSFAPQLAGTAPMLRMRGMPFLSSLTVDCPDQAIFESRLEQPRTEAAAATPQPSVYGTRGAVKALDTQQAIEPLL